jgi:hypothetical protein
MKSVVWTSGCRERVKVSKATLTLHEAKRKPGFARLDRREPALSLSKGGCPHMGISVDNLCLTSLPIPVRMAHNVKSY